MAITYGKVQPIDATSFRLTWTSDETAPVPFRVYVGGRLVSSWESPTQAGEIILTVPAGDAPFIEVLDKACDIPAIAFSGRITLQWSSITGAANYRIEEYVDSVWTERNVITDNGDGVFTWLSRWLEDVTTHQFRIVPISTAGNEGTPIEKTVFMVRHPDPPDVEYTYNGSSTPTITISAA